MSRCPQCCRDEPGPRKPRCGVGGCPGEDPKDSDLHRLRSELAAATARAEAAEKRADDLQAERSRLYQAKRDKEDRALTAERERDAAREALEPFADCVFNDNGDITTSLNTLKHEHLVAAYFTLKKLRRAALAPGNAPSAVTSSSGQHASTLEGVDRRHTSARTSPEEAPAPAEPSGEDVEIEIGSGDVFADLGIKPSIPATNFVMALKEWVKDPHDTLNGRAVAIALEIVIDRLAGRAG
jgi:hypothetical protein